MPLRISQLLDPARITLSLAATKRTNAIRDVARMLRNPSGRRGFPGSFYQELLARDPARYHVPWQRGRPLPHARTEHAMARIVVAFGRCDAGVAYEEGEDPVRLIFLHGTTKSKPGDNLMLVGTLCRLIKYPSNREALFYCAHPRKRSSPRSRDWKNEDSGPRKNNGRGPPRVRPAAHVRLASSFPTRTMPKSA